MNVDTKQFIEWAGKGQLALQAAYTLASQAGYSGNLESFVYQVQAYLWRAEMSDKTPYATVQFTEGELVPILNVLDASAAQLEHAGKGQSAAITRALRAKLAKVYDRLTKGDPDQ